MMLNDHDINFKLKKNKINKKLNNNDNIVDDIKWYNLLLLWGIETNHYESMLVPLD